MELNAVLRILLLGWLVDAIWTLGLSTGVPLTPAMWHCGKVHLTSLYLHTIRASRYKFHCIGLKLS